VDFFRGSRRAFRSADRLFRHPGRPHCVHRCRGLQGKLHGWRTIL